MSINPDLRVLDCTLRDGGYYTSWDFPKEVVERYLESMRLGGVDLVELGYKSPRMDGFSGLYQYCPDTLLEELEFDRGQLEFAFMIDVKSFMRDGKLDENLLNSRVQDPRLFSWVRLASHAKNMDATVEAAKILHSRGYKVVMNLMGVSLLSDAEYSACLSKVDAMPLEYFYFADSFGSFGPKDISKLLEKTRSTQKHRVGFHAHDNKGLAYANALTALDQGIDILDATLTGMGRGAGNLKTEQLLLSLFFEYQQKQRNSFRVLDIVETYFEPLKRQHGWGFSFSYMLSGINNIHPTYCQKLNASNQYTLKQVSEVLSDIPEPNRSSFNQGALEEATNAHLRGSSTGPTLPNFEPKGSGQDFLIVAKGTGAKEHQMGLRAFAKQVKPTVLEVNHTGLLDGIPRNMVVLNTVRLRQILRTKRDPAVEQVITGLPKFDSEGWPLVHFPANQGAFDVTPTQLTLPSYVAGMYAVGLAQAMGAKRIFLAGFDGFAPSERTQKIQDDFEDMESFWANLPKDLEVVSLTPTHYQLKESSPYGWLE